MDDDVRTLVGALKQRSDDHEGDIRRFAEEVGKSLVIQTEVNALRREMEKAHNTMREDSAERFRSMYASLDQRFGAIEKRCDEMQKGLTATENQKRETNRWKLSYAVTLLALLTTIVFAVLQLVQN